MNISKTICTLTVALLAGCGPTIINWDDDFTPLTAVDTATGEPDDTATPPDIPDDCTPGTESCPCDIDGGCDDRLECNAAGECEPSCAPTIDCVVDGLCWAWLPGWSVWAQYADDIFDGFEPVEIGLDADCYQVLGPARHMCVVTVDCVELLGVPVSEILTLESTCADLGPWEAVLQTNTQCFGVVKGVAVLLDPNH